MCLLSFSNKRHEYTNWSYSQQVENLSEFINQMLAIVGVHISTPFLFVSFSF